MCVYACVWCKLMQSVCTCLILIVCFFSLFILWQRKRLWCVLVWHTLCCSCDVGVITFNYITSTEFIETELIRQHCKHHLYHTLHKSKKRYKPIRRNIHSSHTKHFKHLYVFWTLSIRLLVGAFTRSNRIYLNKQPTIKNQQIIYECLVFYYLFGANICLRFAFASQHEPIYSF